MDNSNILEEGVNLMISFLYFLNLVPYIDSHPFQTGLGFSFFIVLYLVISMSRREVHYLRKFDWIEAIGEMLLGDKYYKLEPFIHIFKIIIIVLIIIYIIVSTVAYINNQSVDFRINFILGIVSGIVSGTISGVVVVIVCRKMGWI